MNVAFDTVEQIRLKKAQYCRFLDTKQWESFAKLALPDARFIFYSVNDDVLYDFPSTEALVKPTARLLEDARTSHRVCNSEIYSRSENYAQLARDIRSHTHLTPDFARACHQHEVIDAIEKASASGHVQSVVVKRG